jgi:hypothetical protein
MKLVYRGTNIPWARLKKLSTYVKKMSKYGVFIEEMEPGKISKRHKTIEEMYSVKIFAPKLHTDILGNTAIKS